MQDHLQAACSHLYKNPTMPKVSVIIPLYNAASYLPDLKQLWEQTLQDFELILVDDCSTDDTWAKLQEFKAQNPERTIILARNEHNLGPGGTRNHGLTKSSGEYIIFLDGDDRYDPTLLEKMSKRLDDTHADLVCFGIRLHEGEQTKDLLYEDRLIKEIARYNAAQGDPEQLDAFTLEAILLTPSIHPSPCNKMVRRDFLLAHNITFPDMTFGEDRCWVMHMALKAHRIEIVNEPLYHYILHSDSLTHRFDEKYVTSSIELFNFSFNLLITKDQYFKLYDVWLYHFWDTLFSQYNRLELTPELQRLLLSKAHDFCVQNQISLTPLSPATIWRAKLYKVLPKVEALLPLRTKLKEQYRVVRLIKRFNELL